MANIVHGPSFQFAKTVPLSDTIDNATGASGLHNAGATAGLASVIFQNDSGPETLRLEAGQFVLCAIRRVRSTGTTILEADLRVLY